MGENSSKIGVILSTKMTITRKMKIGKIVNLVFLYIQPIPDIPYKFEKFQHHLFFLFVEGLHPSTKKTHPGSGNFFLELVDSIIQIWKYLYYSDF